MYNWETCFGTADPMVVMTTREYASWENIILSRLFECGKFDVQKLPVLKTTNSRAPLHTDNCRVHSMQIRFSVVSLQFQLLVITCHKYLCGSSRLDFIIPGRIEYTPMRLWIQNASFLISQDEIWQAIACIFIENANGIHIG